MLLFYQIIFKKIYLVRFFGLNTDKYTAKMEDLQSRDDFTGL